MNIDIIKLSKSNVIIETHTGDKSLAVHNVEVKNGAFILYCIGFGESITLHSKDLNKTWKIESKQNDSFEVALRPAVEYLKGRHPHHSIIVTSLHAELLEGVEVISEEVPEIFEGTLKALNSLTNR